jgi:hypothetical protein
METIYSMHQMDTNADRRKELIGGIVQLTMELSHETERPCAKAVRSRSAVHDWRAVGSAVKERICG